jgi:uncharacterized protein YxeA
MKQVLKGSALPKEVSTPKSYSGIIALVVIVLLSLPLFANESGYDDGKKPHKSGYNYKKLKRKIKRAKRRNRLFNANGCKKVCYSC